MEVQSAERATSGAVGTKGLSHFLRFLEFVSIFVILLGFFKIPARRYSWNLSPDF